MIEPRSVYEMEGRFRGRRLWIVAPGPSSVMWPQHQKAVQGLGEPVLALNSALELVEAPTLWMYADKRFSWLYGHELHGDGKTAPAEIVIPSHQAGKIRKFFAGQTLWIYDYQMQLTRRIPAAEPFWYCPWRRYLPGRCSVFNNALSLAWLLGADPVIAVGVDFSLGEDGSYYHPEVVKNRGPTDKGRALGSGIRYFRKLRKQGVWPGLNLETTSPAFAAAVGIPLRTWEELL